MNFKNIVIFVLGFLISSVGISQNLDNGKTLFRNNCAACHAKDMTTKMVGPALSGVKDRWGGREKLLNDWIRNSAAVIATGDEYAVNIFNEYNKMSMTGFPNLKDEEITDILGYIEGVSNGSYGVKKKAAIVDSKGSGEEVIVEEQSSFVNWVLIGMISILALMTLVLLNIIHSFENIQRLNKGLPMEQTSVWSVFRSKPFKGLVTFFAILFGGYFTIVSAMGIGRQANYQPDQPIKYSHETHAGMQQIDCNYCHDGARRSKHAVIPAANTCMNCHKAIKSGSKYGQQEITKIFASIGYDPNTDSYIEDFEKMPMSQVKRIYTSWFVNNGSPSPIAEDQWKQLKESLTTPQKKHVGGPIPWVRIHNLPDHVYFNHSQHVTVGGIECQTCHGEIQEMEVVSQHAPLSMGWCVNCHRKTDVKAFKDNNYYKSHELLHKELSEGERSGVKVEEIGGLDCQKCHY